MQTVAGGYAPAGEVLSGIRADRRIPVATTTRLPITLYQRKARGVKNLQAKITASPTRTPENAAVPVTLGK
jgi:hypothetical protein